MEHRLDVRQGFPQPCLGLRLAGLRRLKTPLGGGRLLRCTLLLRWHRGHLDRSVLGLTAGGLQLTLKLGHLGMLHPQETGVAGRHLLQTLRK